MIITVDPMFSIKLYEFNFVQGIVIVCI